MAKRDVHKQHRSLLAVDSTNNNWAIVPDSLPAFRIYGPSVKRVLIKRKVETTLSEEYSNGLKMQTKGSGKQWWRRHPTSTRRQPNLYIISWVKRDQLDATCFIITLFSAQHVSDVNTSILRRLRLICWVISWVVLIWLDVCWCYVVVWLGWCGIRMQAEALVPQPAYGYHTTIATLQRNTNTHRTRYNPW